MGTALGLAGLYFSDGIIVSTLEGLLMLSEVLTLVSLGLLFLVGGLGLWRHRRWGWFLLMAASVGLMCLQLFRAMEGHFVLLLSPWLLPVIIAAYITTHGPLGKRGAVVPVEDRGRFVIRKRRDWWGWFVVSASGMAGLFFYEYVAGHVWGVWGWVWESLLLAMVGLGIFVWRSWIRFVDEVLSINAVLWGISAAALLSKRVYLDDLTLLYVTLYGMILLWFVAAAFRHTRFGRTPRRQALLILFILPIHLGLIARFDFRSPIPLTRGLTGLVDLPIWVAIIPAYFFSVGVLCYILRDGSTLITRSIINSLRSRVHLVEPHYH